MDKVRLHFSTGRGGDFVESAGIFLGLTNLKIFMQNGIPSFSLEYRKCRFFFWSAKKRIKKSAMVLNSLNFFFFSQRKRSKKKAIAGTILLPAEYFFLWEPWSNQKVPKKKPFGRRTV